MTNDVTSRSGEQAKNISSDLDALRELDGEDIRPGWPRQFATIMILVSAFVVIVWFGSTRSISSERIVFNAGVVVNDDMATDGWVGLALEQALVATVRSGDQLQLINPTKPSTTFAAFGPSATSSTRSGANWILHAVLSKATAGSEAIIVRLSLTEVGDEQPVFSADVLGSANSISDLATRCVEQIFVWLELGSLSNEQLGFANNEIPASRASEFYGKGLAALAAGDGQAAIDQLGAADRAAPNNAAIHEALANAWEYLGYAQNAASESNLALAASQSLSRQRQLELEAAFARRAEDWPRAEEVFAALKEFSPDNLSYRLAIADSQARQNNGDGFAKSIRQMRALASDARSDPRIDLAEAEFWFRSGDYEKCSVLARDAKTKAEQSDDLTMLGEALLAVGRCDDSYDPDVFLQARDIFIRLNTSVREPEILRELAKHEFAEGNMPNYLQYTEEAVAQAQRLQNEPETAATQSALAIAYDLHGWLTRGHELKVKVAQYQKERNNLNRYSIMLENIGISLLKLGRHNDAEAIIDQAEKVFVEIDDKIGIAWLPYRRGQIELRRGNIDSARALMTQAFQNAAERPEGGLEKEATFELGLIEFYAGNFDHSKSHLDNANQYYRSGSGLSASIAETEIALSRLAGATGNSAGAQQHLKNAEEALAADAAYYLMSLRTEQANFSVASSMEERRAMCAQLEAASEDQEHRRYLLRAKAKIVACRGLLDAQPYSISHAMLVAVEEEAGRLGLFEERLAVGYVRAALLSHAGRTDEASLEVARVDSIAREHTWAVLPFPDLKISPTE